MFGDKGPSLPSTLISTNAYYDPWKLVDVGTACRTLRYDDILIIGTGGAVHNLYANKCELTSHYILQDTDMRAGSNVSKAWQRLRIWLKMFSDHFTPRQFCSRHAACTICIRF